MDKQKMLEKMGTFGLNLYDAAIIDEEGILEKRYQPSNACNNSYSITKAFTVSAIGLLQDNGILSVMDRVVDFFPEWKSHHPGWNNVTIHHALKHMIGFADNFLNIDEDIPEFLDVYRNYDYLKLISQQEIAYEPGTHFAYSDTAFYLLSRVISAACHRTEDELLREHLIIPMDFGSIAWSRCPAGYPIGATGLYISARDMVKLGWLYQQGGVYNGKRLLSSKWVNQVIDNGYEFKSLNGTCLIGKGGLYCQMVLFSPNSAFAAAWHAYSQSGSDREMIAWLAAC